MPGKSFAGSSGCAPGRTAQRSGSFGACACLFFAITPEVVAATMARRSAAKDGCFIADQYRQSAAGSAEKTETDKLYAVSNRNSTGNSFLGAVRHVAIAPTHKRRNVFSHDPNDTLM